MYSRWHWPTWNRWIYTRGSNHQYNYFKCNMCIMSKMLFAKLRMSCNVVATITIMWFLNNWVHSFCSRKTNWKFYVLLTVAVIMLFVRSFYSRKTSWKCHVVLLPLLCCLCIHFVLGKQACNNCWWKNINKGLIKSN